MKSIHNREAVDKAKSTVVFNTSKIQNEINSQLNPTAVLGSIGCFQYVKDTK